MASLTHLFDLRGFCGEPWSMVIRIPSTSPVGDDASALLPEDRPLRLCTLGTGGAGLAGFAIVVVLIPLFCVY